MALFRYTLSVLFAASVYLLSSSTALGVSYTTDQSKLVAHYWTYSKLQNAQELRPALLKRKTSAALLGAPTTFSGPFNSVFDGHGISAAVWPASAIGKVYGTYLINGQHQDYQCSGSVINTPRGNTVLTAAHCVINQYSEAHGHNLIFVPGETNHQAIFGFWSVKNFQVPGEWSQRADAGDLALLELNKLNGRTIQQTVGSLGIAFDQPLQQTYTQYGYPATAPYTGRTLYELNTDYVTCAYADASQPCDPGIYSNYTGGSSGGPWVIDSNNPTVVSVTSFSSLDFSSIFSQPQQIDFGPYFGAIAQNLYTRAGGSAAGAAPYPITPHLLAHRGRVVATLR